MMRLIKLFILSCTLWIAISTSVQAQCMLSNPSFEISGAEGLNFAGWSQYGAAGMSNDAYHGAWAAKLSNEDTGSANESGYWHRIDCEPSEQWEIQGHVLNSSHSPLSGECLAAVKVEYFDAANQMLDDEIHVVADAASAVAEYLEFSLLSSPAPPFTVAIRLVLSLLQSDGDPAAEVYFDQISCFSTTAPTIHDMQWEDFPSGRSLEFSDMTWRVKGSGWYGPGPNNFSHLPQSIWVDAEDQLHLTIQQIDGVWNSTELTLLDTLGYGDYVFTTRGDLGALDMHTVLGLFLWQYGPCWDPASSWWNPYNEIDIEYSRWGNANNQIGQFVAQPWDWDGNMNRYDATFGTDQLSSHAFRWLPDRVEFRSWYGDTQDESPQNMIHQWIYNGPHIPRPEQPRVHINLWYFGSPPATYQEVVISEFNFVPANGSSETTDELHNLPAITLQQNYPNPFNPKTRIRFSLPKTGEIKLMVYDLKGRRVATLVDEAKAAGDYDIQWDAGDSASGIYFYRLQTFDGTLTRKMLLLK